jgi:hypothetical protein
MWLGLDRAKILIKMLVTAGRTNHTFGLWLWIRRKKKVLPRENYFNKF